MGSWDAVEAEVLCFWENEYHKGPTRLLPPLLGRAYPSLISQDSTHLAVSSKTLSECGLPHVRVHFSHLSCPEIKRQLL